MSFAIEFFQSRYRVLRPSGQGGRGTVYLVEDTLLGRRCAIKESIPDPTAALQAPAQLCRQFQIDGRTPMPVRDLTGTMPCPKCVPNVARITPTAP